MRLLVALLLAVAASPSPAPAQAAPTWEDLAVRLLRQYLQADTTNPPGNELKAALFYKGLIEAEGIPVIVDEFAPGRANLMAVLKGSGARRPLVLANHMDVVPADASRWSVAPFAGVLKDGVVYGRGAEDMKTEGILQLLALLRLKRDRVALDRDVIFLATADEEADFLGALRAVSPEGWRDRIKDAEFLVTEVQIYLKDHFPTQTVYGPTPDAELRLITCGGAFDPATGHYLSNIVVYATQVR